jgi:hypothetical protein
MSALVLLYFLQPSIRIWTTKYPTGEGLKIYPTIALGRFLRKRIM